MGAIGLWVCVACLGPARCGRLRCRPAAAPGPLLQVLPGPPKLALFKWDSDQVCLGQSFTFQVALKDFPDEKAGNPCPSSSISPQAISLALQGPAAAEGLLQVTIKSVEPKTEHLACTAVVELAGELATRRHRSLASRCSPPGVLGCSLAPA
jgi:hypothetical protein